MTIARSVARAVASPVARAVASGVGGGITRYSIRKTAASGFGNAGFSASNILPVNSTILLSCEIGAPVTTFMLGQDTANEDDATATINWAGYVSTSALQSYFQGSVSGSPTSFAHTWQVGDKFTMRQVGTAIDYLINDISRVNASIAHSSTDQVIDVAINTQNSVLANISLFVDGIEQQIEYTELRGCEFV